MSEWVSEYDFLKGDQVIIWQVTVEVWFSSIAIGLPDLTNKNIGHTVKFVCPKYISDRVPLMIFLSPPTEARTYLEHTYTKISICCLS